MKWWKEKLHVKTRGKGMYSITDRVTGLITEWGIEEGMCHLFIQHTSASLVINESYDPTAKQDMETFMEKVAPEGESWHRHTLEGEDDSPSHMRAIITGASLSIPVDQASLNLGTWQGIYVFEHRASGSTRSVLIRCLDAG